MLKEKLKQVKYSQQMIDDSFLLCMYFTHDKTNTTKGKWVKRAQEKRNFYHLI